jgi:hypothetical protein
MLLDYFILSSAYSPIGIAKVGRKNQITKHLLKITSSIPPGY